MKVTKAHRLNCQIHTYPVEDSGIRHTVSLTCKCKPNIELVAKTIVAVHNMVGSGPDKWNVETRNLSVFTLEETQ